MNPWALRGPSFDFDSVGALFLLKFEVGASHNPAWAPWFSTQALRGGAGGAPQGPGRVSFAALGETPRGGLA